MDGAAQFRGYDPLPLISALNLVLQQYPTLNNGVRVGQNRFFFPELGMSRLTPGIQAVKGFYVSVRPVYQQLMVKVYVIFYS